MFTGTKRRAQELCESGGGRPGPSSLCGRRAACLLELNSELRSCVKVEVAVLGLVVSVDVEQQQ